MRMHLLLLLGLCILTVRPAATLAAEMAVVQSPAPTTDGGTQDFTSTGFGTPACALFFAGYGTTNGTVVDQAGFFVGGYDGTRQNSVGQAAEDAQLESDTGNVVDADSAIVTLLATSQAKDGDGTASWITDGARLAWADAPPSAYRVNAVLFGGSGVSNCYVGTATGNATLGGTTVVGAPGFTPDLVIAWSANLGTGNWRPSFGIATNEAGTTIVQRSISSSDTNALLSMQVAGQLSTNRIVMNPIGFSALELTSFDTSGFTVTTMDSASGVPSFGYLAVKFTGLAVKLMTSPAPAGTGSDVVTGVGFRPQFGMMLQGEYAAVDTSYITDNGEVFGVSAFTATGSVSASAFNEDSDGTSNTKSMTDANVCRTVKDGADYATCALTSLDADGATFNYTTNVGGVKQRAILFVQAGATAASFGPLKRRAQ